MKPIKGRLILLFVLLMTLWVIPQTVTAHCDSYDGPVIKDALKGLEEKEVSYVLKWIEEKHEEEIRSLFAKTYALKNGDQEIYQIVKKHFLETLVRLHREGEGAPYTGLKPAGTTKPIIVMADKALAENDIDGLAGRLNAHIEQFIREKYQKVAALSNEKDKSAAKGRAYVAAYVDYTHALEAIHDILEHGEKEHGGH